MPVQYDNCHIELALYVNWIRLGIPRFDPGFPKFIQSNTLPTEIMHYYIISVYRLHYYSISVYRL